MGTFYNPNVISGPCAPANKTNRKINQIIPIISVVFGYFMFFIVIFKQILIFKLTNIDSNGYRSPILTLHYS